MSRPPTDFIDVDVDFDKKSLKAMCIRRAVKYANAMESIGSIPYHIARHFLHRIDSANRLALIEQNSPHIIGDDAELWQKLIRHEFENWDKKNYQPEDEAGTDWHGVYLRYQADKEADLAQAQAVLRRSYSAALGQRAQNVSQKVEAKYLPKPPRDPKMLANGGILISRRPGGSSSYGRQKPVGFIGQAATGIKRQRNLVELARREAAAQVAMRKQAKPFIPDTKSQIRKAPAGLVQQHESEDRAKRLALPPMPESNKPKKMDPIEARIARIKAAKAAKDAKEKGLEPPQVEENNKDVADLFDDSLLAPSERKRELSPPRIQLPGGGTARRVPAKISPRLNPVIPRAPPKKVDIFFSGKKKPVAPISRAPTTATTSTAAIPNLNLNGPRNAFTPARLPPRMTSMAQGARGAIRPTGTIASRKAVEMKSMRPVNAVADRQGAGRPSASAAPPPRPTAASQRPLAATTARFSAPQQKGASGVASMLAGLVAKQDAEKVSRPSPPQSTERSSTSLKRAAPAEAPVSAAKRIHTQQPLSRSSSSTNSQRPQPVEKPSPSLKRPAPMDSPAPAAKRMHTDAIPSRLPSSSQDRTPNRDAPRNSPLPMPQLNRQAEVRRVEQRNERAAEAPTSKHDAMLEKARAVTHAESGRDWKPFERKKTARPDGTYLPPHLRGEKRSVAGSGENRRRER